MGPNGIDWRESVMISLVTVGKTTTTITAELELSALDAQLEVISAEANNLIGSGHFNLVTERSDIEVTALV